MKINDLKRYKPLDITQLSGSPWNNAEKVLGLDENDKVIMAEPDDVVTLEDVADAVNQAMEAETARTEDAYAKKDEIPDMEDYYTKEEVDEAISGITVDLSDYYTKDETDQAISAATQDLASTDYVDDAIAAIPEPDLSNYYTKGETDGAISTALVPYATKGWVESKSYVNGAFVDAKVDEAIASETARTESVYAKKTDIPDMSDYVSKDELTGSTEQQAIEIGADDTSVTITIFSDDLETLNMKSTSVNKYKVLDISGWATSTNVWPQYFSYSGISQMGFQDFVMMVPDTPYTLTQGEGNHSQITFSGTSPTYLVLNIEDNTVYVSDNLPSVAVEVPGVLDDYAKTTDIPVVPTNVSAFNNDAGYLTQHQSLANYYNKTEIDNMVGDIESLLANI